MHTYAGHYYRFGGYSKKKILPSCAYLLVEKKVKGTRKTWFIKLLSAVEKN